MHERASQHAARSQLQCFRDRSLVASLPFVRQDKSVQATRKNKQLMVLLMSMVYCDQKATAAKHCWPCNHHLCGVRRVPCIHASRISVPAQVNGSIILSSPPSMCDILDLFHRLSFCARGARKNCTGDVSPADAGDKNKKTGEPNSLSSPHVDIEGLVRR